MYTLQAFTSIITRKTPLTMKFNGNYFFLEQGLSSLETFINENIQPGSNIATDSWSSYSSIIKEQYHHVPTNQSKVGKDHDSLYGVHLITTLVKRLVVNKRIKYI